MSYKFMISGGGTGGHIFPALAIADELKKRFPDAQFLFVGASNRMEMQRVPQAGYKIEGLWISGIQRKITLSNLSFPFKLIASLWKCRNLIRRFRPHAVIGTGGFASGPLLYQASKKNIPCLIQEQNSYPGITNKILGKRVEKICVAYPGMERFFDSSKLILTGNPIRASIKAKLPTQEDAQKHFGFPEIKPTLLIVGGSLGSRRINELIAESLPALLKLDINIIWQCGKIYHEALKKKFKDLANRQVLLTDFLDDMNQAFAASSVIISRAGAGTLSELAVAGKAAVLIPSPNVAEDHQTKNARALSSRDAAVLFKESRSAEELISLLGELISDREQRTTLEENISKLALPQASEHIADEIEKMLKS